MVRPTEIDVEDLMDVGAGDEAGVPDAEVEHCPEHDVFYHEDDRCIPCEREEGEGDDGAA